MVNMVPGLINDTYELYMPDFRVDFHAERPWWEKGRIEHCAEYMSPGMTVLDIGAEHGDFTALYKQFVGPFGDVIPIEPMPHYWPYIRMTYAANQMNDPSLYYVGLIGIDTVGPRRPIDRAWPAESEGEGIPDGGFAHLRQNRDHPVSTIDNISKVIRPDAIVLDIEGAEFLALQGGRLTLRAHRPLVWVSVHDIDDGAGWPGPLFGWYRATARDIDEFMSDLEYDREELPSHGEGERFVFYSPR